MIDDFFYEIIYCRQRLVHTISLLREKSDNHTQQSISMGDFFQLLRQNKLNTKQGIVNKLNYYNIICISKISHVK